MSVIFQPINSVSIHESKRFQTNDTDQKTKEINAVALMHFKLDIMVHASIESPLLNFNQSVLMDVDISSLFGWFQGADLRLISLI